MIVDFFLLCLGFFLFLYDVITYPIYSLVQLPYLKKKKIKKGADWHEIANTETHISWTKETTPEHKQYAELILKDNVDTVDKAWNNSTRIHGKKLCLGTRKVHGEEDEKQSSGKVFKKLNLGEYEWLSYNDAHQISTNFGCGLLKLGQQAKMPISIYAETKQEWLLSALGAFSQNMVVSTLYTNLGEEAVCHGINETEVSVVITSHALLPKFKTILDNCPKVTHVIFIEDPLFKTNTEGFKEGVEILSFQSVAKIGEENPAPPNPPETEDIAIIMYTSGSTGVPKGVMISHKNLIATSTCIIFARDHRGKDDSYIAYLPAAHVLELNAECTMLVLGVPIGFSSPNTMTDVSTAIKHGQKGDATLLKPTIMCTVPLILDRIYKNMLEGVKKKGIGFKKFFDFCFNYKVKWNKLGYTTPILNALIFNKIKAILGGRMDFMIVGSAPLSPKTQEFMRTCIEMKLVQGFSMTETTCSGTLQRPGTMDIGLCGGPMAGMEVRLVNWDEGNYKITDKPHPRGEIFLGGNPVTRGYYKNEEKTLEDFFIENGKQFFKSGDIGELQPSGQIRIIDRKKDLVKLQLGEYVSLGKVESQMKINPLVDNICVYADSNKTHTVAMVVPDRNNIEKMARDPSNAETAFEDLCKDPKVLETFVKKLMDHGKKNGLEKFEIPTVVTLYPEIWVPESGLVTAAFKLKRKAIQTAFQADIDRMYGK